VQLLQDKSPTEALMEIYLSAIFSHHEGHGERKAD
jgi:hypothetical protein